jgi:hypothetical protein
MPPRLFVLADAALPTEAIQDCRALAGEMAGYLGEPVGLAVLPKTRMLLAQATVQAAGGGQYAEEVQPSQRAAPMSAAEFVWREDGRPNWAEMWTGFCELALYGGPPHRGEDNPVQALGEQEATTRSDEFDAVSEILRGIWETTGLYGEPAETGWIAVRCESRKMAAWLCATIILENVDARCEGELLYVPAAPVFELKDQVKSVITVLAKTHHYWQAHVKAQTPAALAATA